MARHLFHLSYQIINFIHSVYWWHGWILFGMQFTEFNRIALSYNVAILQENRHSLNEMDGFK